MIRKKVKLSIFEWKIVYLFTSNTDTKRSVKKAIRKETACKNILRSEIKLFKRSYFNGAMTYTFPSQKLSLIIFSKIESPKMVSNIVAHENNHVVDRITEILHINDGETKAYIAGYLAQKLHFLKNHLVK